MSISRNLVVAFIVTLTSLPGLSSPALGQGQNPGQSASEALQEHIRMQLMLQRAQAYYRAQAQFREAQYKAMMQQRALAVKYVKKAKEDLPGLEVAAKALYEQIPSLAAAMDAARQAADAATLKRRDVARELVNAKKDQKTNDIARLETSLKELTSVERETKKELSDKGRTLADANKKLKQQVFEIQTIKAIAPQAEQFLARTNALSERGKDGKKKESTESTDKKSDSETAKKPKEKRNISDRTRKWISANGKFEIYARLLRQANNAAILKTTDGREITVPTSRLSKKDVEYLKSQ